LTLIFVASIFNCIFKSGRLNYQQLVYGQPRT